MTTIRLIFGALFVGLVSRILYDKWRGFAAEDEHIGWLVMLMIAWTMLELMRLP